MKLVVKYYRIEFQIGETAKTRQDLEEKIGKSFILFDGESFQEKFDIDEVYAKTSSTLPLTALSIGGAVGMLTAGLLGLIVLCVVGYGVGKVLEKHYYAQEKEMIDRFNNS